MFSMPKIITKYAKAIVTRAEVHADASLAKTRKLKQQQADQLAIWSDLQDDKMSERIDEHLTRERLSPERQAAVDAWRANVKKKESASEL